MQVLTQETFNSLIEAANIPKRMRGEVKFLKHTEHMTAEDWHETEILAIPDRTDSKGVLLVSVRGMTYATPYELSRGIVSKTGKAQAIICDLCRTWQTGSRSGSITFTKNKKAGRMLSMLCCADLACSQHVRTKTSASKTSRAQLREDLTNEQRIERLEERLDTIITRLELK